MSYALTSASGLMIGFAFFLVTSAAIAFMIYVLLTRRTVRRSEIGLGTVRTSIAAPLASAIEIAIFATIYVTSLAGFHTIVVGDEDIRIMYAVPPSAVALPYTVIGEATAQPAYKFLWRLKISTREGRIFESAPGSSPLIKEAAAEIERRRHGTAVANYRLFRFTAKTARAPARSVTHHKLSLRGE